MDSSSESSDEQDPLTQSDAPHCCEPAAGMFKNTEEALAEEVAALEKQERRLEVDNERLSTVVFCANRILNDEDEVQYYTGFPSPAMLWIFLSYWKDQQKTMRTWQGGRTNFDRDRQGAKAGPSSKLRLLDQFFCVSSSALRFSSGQLC